MLAFSTSASMWARLALAVVMSLGLSALAADPWTHPIRGTGFSLVVTPYANSVARVTVTPNGGSFYQVPFVVIAQPSDVEPSSATCADDDHCEISYGECAVTYAADAVTGAETSRVTVTVQYSCGGAVLTKATMYVSEAPKAHVRFEFPQAKTLYGLAEHAADLALRQGQTYEMWNTDAFEYPTNSTRGLYGSIPFVMAYAAKATTGILFLNSADTNVRVVEEQSGAAPACDWDSEVGPIDVFFMPGPSPANVQRQHASLTGGSLLPPYFSLGYHQCRWNYFSTKDCLAVDEGFDRHNMPYDVLWLDIEHTDKKKYFTWDSYSFPDPKVLTDALASKGRKLVTVKDPHVKRDDGYHVHKEAMAGKHYIRNAKGDEYIGDCWPGKSSWPDFYNSRTRDWYSSLFHDSKYPGGSRDIHTWVDMNEPSVFDGPKKTMAKDAVHVADDGTTLEHRYLHNAYALLSIMSVYQGSLEAGGEGKTRERPFVLTRGFFAGSQRYAAMWNGDNAARWEHLQNTQPELLSLSVSNYPFCGCDVGGFFHTPEEELFVRWMQAGVFYPFFRAHAHLETKRREPWTFSPEVQNHLRNALALRYALIPYLYTAFYHAHRHGETILRPLIYEFPQQEDLREVQDTFLFGPALLVSPIVHKGAKSTKVILPRGTTWYRYQTGEMAQGTGSEGITLPVQLETIPLYVRGGYIVPTKLRLRRNTVAARLDPFTLLVALNAQGNSHGDLYVDDGSTYDYEAGRYVHRQFSYSDGKLRCSSVPESSRRNDASANPFLVPNKVERIIVMGFPGQVNAVHAAATDSADAIARPLEFERLGNSIIVRKPEVAVGDDWVVTFVSK